ncbi:MAG: hypothetical protein M3O36_00675 [Myxococcota bacterium]|nr:hypothetical protein [Myxococcota bacterium]
MHPRRFSFFTSLGISAVMATAATFAGPARAETEFDVSVSNAQVVVTARSGWHINKDYPWKLVIGEAKLDKTKFALAETTATLAGAPKGTGKLKGAVCSADACHTFETEVTIK